MDKAEQFHKIITIKNTQREINKEYEKNGLTDEILDKQIELNRLRNKHNITDETEHIHETYVQ